MIKYQEISILAQQHSGSSGSNVPIAGGGVGHQASSLNPVAGSASHGIGAGGISHHSASGSNHSSSLLWAKTQQLPEELFRQVCKYFINAHLIGKLQNT